MAVKIGTDSVLRMIRPSSYKFTLDELNDSVNGFIEPLKIGPLWVMYSEDSKNNGEPLNVVASFFFDFPMHGNVLVVPPHQLPNEWDIMEPEDYRYTADDIDSGFLTSLQQALIYTRMFGEDLNETINKSFIEPIEQWTYKPGESIPNDKTEDLFTFYNKSYEYMVKNPNSIQDNIIFAEDNVNVNVSPDDMTVFINQLIDHFVNVEEYEKCAKLKKIYEELTVN